MVDNTIEKKFFLDWNGVKLLWNKITETFAKKSDVIKVDTEFKVDSQSLNALTHKAIATMFGTLSERITQIPKFKISVVDELPKNGFSTSTIYLLKSPLNSPDTSDNLYTEYIYVSSGASGKWEKLGEQTLVNSDFVDRQTVEQLINKALNDVINDLNSKLTDIKDEILTEIDGKFLTQAIADTIYVKNSELDDFMTEDEIIESICDGNIGNNIRISDEQIEQMTNN